MCMSVRMEDAFIHVEQSSVHVGGNSHSFEAH